MLHDPASAAVQLSIHARKLNELLAHAGKPEIRKLIETCTEIRTLAGDIRGWAFEKEVEIVEGKHR